jgi:hypothetical protein
MYIPMATLRKLRINFRKKLGLLFLFALGSFAVISSIVRAVIIVTDGGNIKTAFIWSTIEQLVCILVANGPILRPLFFRGKNFESSGTSNNTHTTGLRAGTLHDVYEMTPKETGVVSVVTAGDGVKRQGVRANNIDVVRTVEVKVQESDAKKDDDRRSSQSSLWMP